SVLTAMGWQPTAPRASEELALWRESTAVACPGAHPLGLALAARARGFRAELWESGPRPWLRAHIVNVHRLLRGPAYGRIERTLADASRAAGIRSHRGRGGPSTVGPGLLLVADHGGPTTAPDPHWIGLVPAPDGTWWVHDPLRRSAGRSPRTLRDWWAASGFDGTKTWIALAAAPEAPGGGPTADVPAHPHHHGPEGRPTELARRAWTRSEAIAALDSPDRIRTQDPAVVWRHARLRAGMTVVEVGAGTGYFALPAARTVGPNGHVYAVDLSEDLVDLVRERAQAEHLVQLQAVHSTVDRIPPAHGARGRCPPG
ncbi:Methyltransferase type 11 domain protein, partial [mine drainage metagenome]